MNAKQCVDCKRTALPDDIRCRDCRWSQWTLREPEWLRRGREGLNRTKDFTGASK